MGILQQFGYSNNLVSWSNLEIVHGELPRDMGRKWLGNVEKPQNSSKPPSLMDFNTWQREQAVVHERLLSNIKTSKYDPGKPNEDSERRDPKNRSSNLEAAVTKRVLTKAHCKTVSTGFGNVKRSRRSPLMIALILWTRKNRFSHVSLVGIKSEFAKHGNVVMMVVRRFTIDCFTKQLNQCWRVAHCLFV